MKEKREVSASATAGIRKSRKDRSIIACHAMPCHPSS